MVCVAKENDMRSVQWLVGVLLAAPSVQAVEPPARVPGGATVVVVQVLGSERESPARLVHALGLQPGTRFDLESVRRARAELIESGWLETLEVISTPLAPDTVAVTLVTKRAAATTVQPLLQLRSDDRITAGAKLGIWGRAGRGERFTLAVAGGDQKLLQLEWNEPRPVLALPVAAMLHAEAVEEMETAEDDIEFDRTVVGTRISFPPRGIRLELSGSLWQVRSSDTTALLSGGRSDHLRRGSLALAWGAPPRRFEWSYFRGSLGLAATSGDAEHQGLEGRLRAASSLGRRCVLATGLELRAVRGLVPRYARVHLGSGPSLRGHAYGVENGDEGLWGGVEARFPLNFWSPQTFAHTGLPTVLHAFADAGAAWGASAPGAVSATATWQQARLRWSAGIGASAYLRRTHPVMAVLGCDDQGQWRFDVRTSYSF
jgi:hypothetical protein